MVNPFLLAYDFRDVSSIVDVGGGEGRLLEKILEFNSELNGLVFDSARTIENVRRRSANGARCSYLKGDFFESVPQGADLYLLCGVLHDWNDEQASQILRNCRRAMAKNGKLLLVEMLVPSTNSADFSKLLDLNMLVMNGGRERTHVEFSGLLDSAGFKTMRTIATLAPQSIVEAVPR
jgi:ubiquinone/menaquinone biosynthesis C-methylase UbiE